LPIDTLSAREREVLRLVGRGLSNKEIANALGISHQTARDHVSRLLRKLGARRRTGLVRAALEPDDPR